MKLGSVDPLQLSSGGVDRKRLRHAAEICAVSRSDIVEILSCIEASRPGHILGNDGRISWDMAAQKLRDQAAIKVISPTCAIADHDVYRSPVEEFSCRI